MSALTIQEVRDYLSIDFEDPATDRMLTALLDAANAYMLGALGTDFPSDDERVKTVEKLLISDLYEHREMSDKVSGSTRHLVDSMLLQVRLEMRGESS